MGYENFPCYQSMVHWLVDVWKQKHVNDVASLFFFFFLIRKAKNTELAAEHLWEAETHWRIPTDIKK